MNAVPAEVSTVLTAYVTAELTTVSGQDQPVSVPVLPIWQSRHQRVMVTTGIGMPHKIYNIRRTPKVSLLYSDPTGSGIDGNPVVLVQGDATASAITVWDDELAEWYSAAWSKQTKGIGTDPLTRRYMSWYYQRVKIHVVPQRIRWWPDGDMTSNPKVVRL
ncbi:pyridoxamine 5'-phosphate oxidase family protein [Kribbella sp. NPDC051770]|uniref:pyridoxamine 5'-phosphate oxidase family protein n=1 Tax=Kribbella sp. NPDC051770 TaxID=3155413 RepID=UPI003444C067